LISKASELTELGPPRKFTGHPPPALGDIALYPAIAIPVERKDVFECPRDHLEALKTCLPLVTKVLIIGWRAMEYDFLTLLQDKLPRSGVSFFIVGKNQEDTRAISAQIADANIAGQFNLAQGAFSDVASSRGADEFLKA